LASIRCGLPRAGAALEASAKSPASARDGVSGGELEVGKVIARDEPVERPEVGFGSLSENPMPAARISSSSWSGPTRTALKGFWEFRVARLDELNPSSPFTPGWHHGDIAAKVGAAYQGHIRWPIISLPRQHGVREPLDFPVMAYFVRERPFIAP